MESDDLKSPPPEDAQLDAWLRSSATLPPLPDAGFSHRVLAALPPSKRQTQARRLGICAAGTLIGLIVVWYGGLHTENFSPSFEPAFTDALVQSGPTAIFAALGITLCSLWYVFRNQLRFLPRL